EALRLKPGDLPALEARGFVHLRLDRPDAAIADYDSVLRSAPGAAGALYGRGVARRRAGDKASGDADIAAATAIRADIADEFAKMGLSAS
ncbi:MAG: hypothetical protein HYZ40_15665, partial [Rhodospirillales bacterium]|nr:hypothetical protein [Rhodospirillales bacterium]